MKVPLAVCSVNTFAAHGSIPAETFPLNFEFDTVGAIAGGIYGALYGFKNVPERLLEHIEKKEEIEELAIKLYEKSN